MAKAKMLGYFKPVTPNNRAWCPKRKNSPKANTNKGREAEWKINSRNGSKECGNGTG